MKDIAEFFKDAMEMQDDYQMMTISGFKSEKKLVKILDGFMEK